MADEDKKEDWTQQLDAEARALYERQVLTQTQSHDFRSQVLWAVSLVVAVACVCGSAVVGC